MGLNNGDNKGGNTAETADLGQTFDSKILPANDAISLTLNELDFHDPMKRSIILGICTRLVNTGKRTQTSLVLEIRHHGALAFLAKNLEQSVPTSEDTSARDMVATRKYERKPSVSAMPRITPEQIAESQRGLNLSAGKEVPDEKFEDGDTLFEKIRAKMAGNQGPDYSGNNGGNTGK